MTKIKKYLILLLAIIITIPSLALAATPSAPTPVDTYFLHGDIQVDSANATVGTVLSVEKNNVEIASTTLSIAGQYIIENVAGISSGDTLVYKVTNTASIPETFVPVNTIFKADLNFVSNIPAPTPTPAPSSGGGGGSAYISNPPTNTSISINNGASITNQATVQLQLSADDAISMAISNNASFTNGSWEDYNTSRDWILSSGEGTKTVYAKFRASNGDASDVISDTITFQAGEVLGVKIEEPDERALQLAQIEIDANDTYSGVLNTILGNTSAIADEGAQTATYEKYTSKLIEGVDGLDASDIDAITYFINYGTVSTKILGAGERAGVINSYKSAFGKLPTDYDSWLDVIKIANGRWPSETSESAEAQAKVSFQKVFLREANMDNANDNAAVTIMAYGLRSASRNLDSEKVAILTFEAIFSYSPSTATDWDIVRAIAYSGAVR